jgi:hypothetical protein
MRRFTVHLVTVVDFEDGDEASDETVQNYQNHLRGMVQSAAQALSLRTIKGARVRDCLGRGNQGQPAGNRTASFHLVQAHGLAPLRSNPGPPASEP